MRIERTLCNKALTLIHGVNLTLELRELNDLTTQSYFRDFHMTSLNPWVWAKLRHDIICMVIERLDVPSQKNRLLSAKNIILPRLKRYGNIYDSQAELSTAMPQLMQQMQQR